MTRETLFRTDFDTQFASFTGWKSLISGSPGKLAPSDLPGFALMLEETAFTAYDHFGHPIGGVQQFSIRIFFAHSQLAQADALELRSDYLALIDTFFSGIYTLPTVSTGDPDRIESITISKIDSPAFGKLDTRSSITLHGSYAFTIF